MRRTHRDPVGPHVREEQSAAPNHRGTARPASSLCQYKPPRILRPYVAESGGQRGDGGRESCRSHQCLMTRRTGTCCSIAARLSRRTAGPATATGAPAKSTGTDDGTRDGDGAPAKSTGGSLGGGTHDKPNGKWNLVSGNIEFSLFFFFNFTFVFFF